VGVRDGAASKDQAGAAQSWKEMKSPNPQAVILSLFAVFILWAFGLQTVWSRFATEVDGTIISSRDIPDKGAPRYATEYKIRGADGREFQYVAGATDASLERSIPVGSRIVKKWGQLGYELNGKWTSFPLYAYSAIFGFAFFALFWAALLQWRSKE
jgi:hypothetical protein